MLSDISLPMPAKNSLKWFAISEGILVVEFAEVILSIFSFFWFICNASLSSSQVRLGFFLAF